jgi:hypothetical protein
MHRESGPDHIARHDARGVVTHTFTMAKNDNAQPRAQTSRTANARTKKRAATRRRDWKPAFLAAFRETGLVAHACEAANVGRSTVYEARTLDEEFAVAWAQVEDEVSDVMERELYRRAVEGIEEPVVSAGKLVTTVTKYSDSLLMFALKARRPEKYRDNVKVEHTGQVKQDTVVTFTPPEEWRGQMVDLAKRSGAIPEE